MASCVDVFAEQETPATGLEIEQDTTANTHDLEIQETIVTAEQELKQASGVSIITAEDIKKRPTVNDLSEIVRKMPGANLTGNSSSGSRGNNRQIDLRGMGPENTLILIDGKAVTSRNAVRYTRSGERDTRGDSNWVPADQVERIEVLRGPAAVRYGSGSMGGVVNIITKRPTETATGSITLFTNTPEDDAEGVTQRTNFSLSGPLTEAITYRFYGNVNKTGPDDADINMAQTDFEAGSTLAAGREGVRNRDLNGLVSWVIDDVQRIDFEAGFSRQGNIYAGDNGTGRSQALTDGAITNSLLGRETNAMYRNTYSITHHGDWSFGTSELSAQYEGTRNRRYLEGQTGSVDGNINVETSKSTSTYDSYLLQGHFDIPLHRQVVTVGADWNRQELDDPSTFNREVGESWYALPNSGAGARSTEMDATIAGLYVEDNIELTEKWMLTPGVRLDHHNQFGANWSPSLNTSYGLTDEFMLKGGIARAFKAPNLYQSNPNYLYRSNGNGCAAGTASTGGCYVLGNESLEPETSINKEIGISFNRAGWTAGLTYFRNDYDNKIVSSNVLFGTVINPANPAQFAGILQWENAKDAVVKGWEGNLGVPLLGESGEILSWNTNFTYMQYNKDSDGNPLSVVPEYTINTMLDWSVSDALELNVTGTFYGEQKPRVVNPNLDSAVIEDNELRIREAYHLWGVGGTYELNESLSFAAGVSNLFDKRIYREGAGTNAGANTYNEPGRAYYASVTASF
ncbi:FepA family TonB-dependent siderophore receptor [Pseudomonas syringae pv. syringae]|nr:FepA family TonB-dependent siderophore receptor [Pseudomonas syringae pv. syringae]MDO1458900.1 FepA family TonB-dependent siderophore receptor [Pseudomonas syringae pv. syringae]